MFTFEDTWSGINSLCVTEFLAVNACMGSLCRVCLRGVWYAYSFLTTLGGMDFFYNLYLSSWGMDFANLIFLKWHVYFYFNYIHIIMILSWRMQFCRSFYKSILYILLLLMYNYICFKRYQNCAISGKMSFH